MILELSDLDTIKDNALKNFAERASQARSDNREALEREIFRLESQLEQLFSFTTLLARRESDVEKTAELWEQLVKTCDLFAGRAFQFAQEHSLDTVAYDHILDIRSAAAELRDLHRP